MFASRSKQRTGGCLFRRSVQGQFNLRSHAGRKRSEETKEVEEGGISGRERELMSPDGLTKHLRMEISGVCVRLCGCA